MPVLASEVMLKISEIRPLLYSYFIVIITMINNNNNNPKAAIQKYINYKSIHNTK